MRATEIERVRALFRFTALPGGMTHVCMPTARRGTHKMGMTVRDADAAAWAVRTFLIEARRA